MNSTALIALLALSVYTNLPQLGDPLPKEAKAEKIDGIQSSLMVDSGEILPAYDLLVGDVSYTICGDTHGITFISPRGQFKTSEGIVVGSTLTQVIAIAKTSPIKRMGWAYYLPLPSGWNAAFIASGDDPTIERLPGNTHVSLLFK